MVIKYNSKGLSVDLNIMFKDLILKILKALFAEGKQQEHGWVNKIALHLLTILADTLLAILPLKLEA